MEPERLATLVEAGDALRTAQDRMLSGDGTADELRDAVERERAAVGALLSVAAELGMSGAVSDRVAGTLHAAALDRDARDLVCLGRLVEELQHVGFGGESLASGPAPSRPGGSGRTRPRGANRGRRQERDAPASSPPDAKRAEGRARAEERAKAEERTRAEDRKRARRAEREARHRLQATERVLANAEQRHASARAAFQDAEEKLGLARADAETAADAHAQAQRAVDSQVLSARPSRET